MKRKEGKGGKGREGRRGMEKGEIGRKEGGLTRSKQHI